MSSMESIGMSIRIILADDHKIVRDGLRSLLEQQPDMEVIAEAENGQRAVELVKELAPDVVIMDIAMPEMNGIEATRRITHQDSGVKVIALSMYSDKRFTAEMLKAGAVSYLQKDCAFEQLARTVRSVVSRDS
jgi:two-component system, NarL family, response regulator NreC